jgi:hypothetical protein
MVTQVVDADESASPVLVTSRQFDRLGIKGCIPLRFAFFAVDKQPFGRFFSGDKLPPLSTQGTETDEGDVVSGKVARHGVPPGRGNPFPGKAVIILFVPAFVMMVTEFKF